MKIYLLGMFCIIAMSTAKAQNTPISASSQSAVQSGPAAAQPSLVESIKKTIVFLETDCLVTSQEGAQTVIPYSGTGFLLSVADSRLPDGVFTYLVTNRHVAQPGIEAGKPCNALR